MQGAHLDQVAVVPSEKKKWADTGTYMNVSYFWRQNPKDY